MPSHLGLWSRACYSRRSRVKGRQTAACAPRSAPDPRAQSNQLGAVVCAATQVPTDGIALGGRSENKKTKTKQISPRTGATKGKKKAHQKKATKRAPQQRNQKSEPKEQWKKKETTHMKEKKGAIQ